jgi:hypothetical protein
VNPKPRSGRGILAFLLLTGLPVAAGASASGFLAPAKGERFAGGDAVELRWSGPCGSAATESELVLSLDGGRTFPIRITPEMSPCAGAFRWRVPDVESAHARLALRSGSGEESENERLSIVSEEFAIVADGDDDDELVPGAREVWTRQALDGDGTEDLPTQSVAGSPEALVAPARTADAHEPPESGIAAPSSAASHEERPVSDASRRDVSSHRRSSATPLPLRL